MTTTTTTAFRPYIQLWGRKRGPGIGVRVYRQCDVKAIVDYTVLNGLQAPRVHRTPGAESVAVVYINQQLPQEFIAGIRRVYDVRNDTARDAAIAIEQSEKRAVLINQAKARISRFDLNTIKRAMVSVFGGDPYVVKQLFVQHGIKIVGHAGLPQCLQLLELERKLQATLEHLENTPKVFTTLPDPFTGDRQLPTNPKQFAPYSELACTIEPLVCPLTCEVPFDNSVEGNPVDIGAVQITDDDIVAAVKTMTKKQLRQFADNHNIDLAGTSKYRHAELLEYILESYFAPMA